MSQPQAQQKSKARKSPPIAELLKTAADKLTQYNNNPEFQKKEKDVNLDNLLAKLTLQTEILEALFRALALPDLNEQGHELKPATDLIGKSRATASSSHLAYRTEVRDYLSGKMKETEFSDFSGDLTVIRRHVRDGYQQTLRMQTAINTARRALEQQRELYAQLHGAEIDEEIRLEKERIAKKQERIAALETKKTAKGGGRKAAANG